MDYMEGGIPAEIQRSCGNFGLDNVDSFTLFTGVSLSVRLEFRSGPSCSKLGSDNPGLVRNLN